MPIKENSNQNKFIRFLQKKLKPTVLQNLSRPKELPPFAHDCGWNHGEQKEIYDEKR
jgi:hypothetical protein